MSHRGRTQAEVGSGPGPVLARLSRPRTATPMRLGVVSDPHITPTGDGTWKVYHRTETRLRTAVELLGDINVDATLLLGDLTRDGAPEEFDCVDEILTDFDTPWVAVPGNHDVPKAWNDHQTQSVGAFAERYGTGAYPFYLSVGDIDVFGLDSATGESGLTDTVEGVVSRRQLDWLDDCLEYATTPIVVLHHNLLHARRHTGQFPDADCYRLRNADAIRSVLAAHDVPLVLSGHIHWPAIAARDGVREVIAPATCSFPQAAMLLDIGPTGTTVRLLPLAGRRGSAEAYIHARTGNAHGQGIAEHAERGYLQTFPRRTERRPAVVVDHTGRAVHE